MKIFRVALYLAVAAVCLLDYYPASAGFHGNVGGVGVDRSNGIAFGADGAMWFTAPTVNEIGRQTANPTDPPSGFPVPTADSGLAAIAPGPDGALWFIEQNANQIGRITVGSTPTISEFPIPTPGAIPKSIIAGPDGAMWFTESATNQIGRITVGASPIVTEFAIPTAASVPVGITPGPDGAMWFVESASNKIGRITVDANTIVTEISLPTANSEPYGITAGPDGALWFTEMSANKIGRITTGAIQAVSEFPVPTANSSPHGITLGSDGGLWFTEYNVNQVGRLVTEPAPTITEYVLPVTYQNPGGIFISYPEDITLGADGWIWFVDAGIGWVNLQTDTLAVSLSGDSQGNVTSSSLGSASLPGIACTSSGAGCSFDFPDGNLITLTASASAGSVFEGWSGGGCSGTGSCAMSIKGDTTVTATFAPIPIETLSITDAGGGIGSVSSSPSGVTCGSTCNASYNLGTLVTLTATAAAGSSFMGWSGGGCSGTANCAVLLNGDTGVTANFALIPTTALLSLTTTGNGAGSIESSPSGIACGPTCNASFNLNTAVTLTATAVSGSTFTGWSGGGCTGIQTCTVTLAQAVTITANFAADSSSDITLVAALLPASRSVQIGSPATFFGTIINASSDTAGTNCTVAPTNSMPASFSFQTTNSMTNALTGTVNTPVTIAPGATQSFLLSLTPTAVISPTNIAFSFTCTNSAPAASDIGVNTLLLAASSTPTPDIVALAATVSNDGIIDIPGAGGTGAFAVATFNVGASGTIEASANDAAANLPVTITICQTDPTSGQCLAAPSASVPTTIDADATPTFAIFVQARGILPFQPAANRIFVQFQDSSGAIRGSTSVAVRTQ